MNTFGDCQGTRWTVAITVAAVKRVRGLLGVDLLDIMGGDPPLLSRLASDYVLICDLLYVICKPQADQAGISDEGFGERMGGEALFNGSIVLMESLADFFLSLNRPETVQALRSGRMLMEAAVAVGAERISQIDVEGVIREIVSRFATSSAESSGLTPAPLPSANCSG